MKICKHFLKSWLLSPTTESINAAKSGLCKSKTVCLTVWPWANPRHPTSRVKTMLWIPRPLLLLATSKKISLCWSLKAKLSKLVTSCFHLVPTDQATGSLYMSDQVLHGPMALTRNCSTLWIHWMNKGHFNRVRMLKRQVDSQKPCPNWLSGNLHRNHTRVEAGETFKGWRFLWTRFRSRKLPSMTTTFGSDLLIVTPPTTIIQMLLPSRWCCGRRLSLVLRL